MSGRKKAQLLAWPHPALTAEDILTIEDPETEWDKGFRAGFNEGIQFAHEWADVLGRWRRQSTAAVTGAAEMRRQLEESIRAVARAAKRQHDSERGRRMTRAREARLGRVAWREKAIRMDHELCESKRLSRKGRAELIARRLKLHWSTVYEALPHDPKGGLRRPRRRRR
jgi:hypothetical protein